MRFCHLLRDRRASVVPFLGLAAVPIIAIVGAAVDLARANAARAAMQAALDTAAIIVAKQALQLSEGELSDSAANYFKANFARPEVADVKVTAAISPTTGGTSIAMSASGSVKAGFVQLIGFPWLAIGARTGAFASADGQGCVLALSTEADGAVTAQGSTTVNLNGCNLYDNSKSPSALTVGGSAAVSAQAVAVVGGVSGNANITTSQGIRTGAGPIVDPYAGDSFANFFGCNEQHFTAKNTVTIDPGVYCDGISVNAGAVLTLNPGIYYLDGGDLSVNGGATIVGSGVTLVFTKKNGHDWATASINGNATVNLTPPKSGPTAGIVIFGDRNIPIGTTFKFNGGASQYLGGAVYLPTAAIQISGGAATGTSCTQVIGHTITFTGNSALTIKCDSYATKPITAPVIRLAF